MFQYNCFQVSILITRLAINQLQEYSKNILNSWFIARCWNFHITFTQGEIEKIYLSFPVIKSYPPFGRCGATLLYTNCVELSYIAKLSHSDDVCLSVYHFVYVIFMAKTSAQTVKFFPL